MLDELARCRTKDSLRLLEEMAASLASKAIARSFFTRNGFAKISASMDLSRRPSDKDIQAFYKTRDGIRMLCSSPPLPRPSPIDLFTAERSLLKQWSNEIHAHYIHAGNDQEAKLFGGSTFEVSGRRKAIARVLKIESVGPGSLPKSSDEVRVVRQIRTKLRAH